VLGDAGGRDALLATLGAGSSAGGAGIGGLGRLSAGTSRPASHAPGTINGSNGERRGGALRGRTATAESESLESLGESECERPALEPLSNSRTLERGGLGRRGETAGSEEVPGGLLARLGRGASVAGSERASTGGGAGALRFEGMRVEAGRRGDRGDSEALMPARVSIPQEGDLQEEPDIEGRMDRHGNRVAMPASDDVGERREALLSLGDARGVGVPDPDADGGRRASTTKTPKKVLFDLDRERARDGEEEEGEGDAGEHGGFQNMMRVDSRPTTGASARFGASRPTTGASSFRDQDSERGSPRGAPKRAAEDVSAEEEHAFFSLVRHNKVPDVEAALEEGFPIDKRDAHGNTTLMVAAQNGHKRLAKMALKHGADPNSTNHQGNTSLHFATSYGYSALSKYLIAHGADDTLMNMKGLTCYDGIG